eukprot:CAMPEP_0201102084 /NCGR_PEP_ID=MMETSP0812-20130820/15649_1 /ASSEMBLY_ACC=CAM_ASM_000668 /TAXON_ID=98059 /ORGANISM="Dinobryon sp., Strain UTEXLB2267" /LENGTH=937 /DNA_ID=CAMNT_0047359413 /DNA_START=1 /DNA_END=2814 /DNA_ORIENTATION=-
MDHDLTTSDNELTTSASAGTFHTVDLKDSVAYGLINEIEKLNQISEVEARYLRNKYKKLFDSAADGRTQEQMLTKRIKLYQNDILAEKIAIEKARVEEADEIVKLQEASETRNILQKELEQIEQKDTMAKFEIFELRRVHDELKNSLSLMKQQNSDLVDPILNRLKQEIVDLTEQLTQTDEAYDREVVEKQGLETRLKELEALNSERQGYLDAKSSALENAELEPGRLERQILSMEHAAENMEQDYRVLQRKIKTYEAEVEAQARRRQEAEKLRKTILEKLELNRQTLEEREHDVAVVRANLDKSRAHHHDLVTRKVELNVRKREMDSHLRHLNDQIALGEKDFDLLKRQLKKKRSNCESARQLQPGLETQLSDQEMHLRLVQDEKTQRTRQHAKLRAEVDSLLVRFLQFEGVESEKRRELELTSAEVDELEAQVVTLLAEGKRQGKLLSVLSAQRDIKGRESARIEAKEKDAKQQVRIKELLILDLTKRCNEISNRLKEFSALYEVVKNERNKYVNLIQSSSQALAEMREKIRILLNEVDILNNERTAKDLALAKEKNAHQQGQNQRDALRQDLNRLLSDYRSKQSTVEQQIQEIDKLNIVINNLEREMLHLKTKYEHSVEQRNVTGVQLIDRNDELCILYERSNQQQEALKRGELESMKKEAELRLVRLQTEELSRQLQAAQKRLPQLEQDRRRVEELEEQLTAERRRTESLSHRLEDPGNAARWRPLEGSDPDLEQLAAKIQVLEDRLDKKREAVLDKELVLEEVTALTEKLRSQAVAKRDAAKMLADQLNELQGKIRDVTKKMLASVSELSMYQATALRLQQEKLHRQKGLEEAQFRLEHGEAPSEDTLKEFQRAEKKKVFLQEAAARRDDELSSLQMSAGMLKTAAEPRPTAYIPDELGIPRPYGNLAPFKPSELGSTMRHIRPPVIKPIEI